MTTGERCLVAWPRANRIAPMMSAMGMSPQFSKHGLVSTGRRLALANCTRVLPSTEPRDAVLRVKREGSCLAQWMSGQERKAARNLVTVETTNKLDRI